MHAAPPGRAARPPRPWVDVRGRAGRAVPAAPDARAAWRCRLDVPLGRPGREVPAGGSAAGVSARGVPPMSSSSSRCSLRPVRTCAPPALLAPRAAQCRPVPDDRPVARVTSCDDAHRASSGERRQCVERASIVSGTAVTLPATEWRWNPSQGLRPRWMRSPLSARGRGGNARRTGQSDSFASRDADGAHAERPRTHDAAPPRRRDRITLLSRTSRTGGRAFAAASSSRLRHPSGCAPMASTNEDKGRDTVCRAQGPGATGLPDLPA